MPINSRIHDVRIIERKITYHRNDRWVQNCVHGDVLRVAWDSEWNYMTDIVAIFVNAADGQRSNPVDISSGQCEIPYNVLMTEGRLFVTIIGYIGMQQRIITQKMERPFLINESGDVYDTLLPEVTDDVLQKILNGAHDVDIAVSNALVIAREAQAIIDTIHSQGFNMDGLLTAIDQLARRATREHGDVWVVAEIMYASYDMAGYIDTIEEGETAAIFKTGSMDDETGTLTIGAL